MEKCASFCQRGNTRKASPFAKIGSAANDSSPVHDETSFVAGGLYLNMLNEGGLLKTRKSQMISEGNASKYGGPCNDMHLPVQCSTMELDLLGQPNCRNSPRTVLQVPNASPSSDFDAISCHPHGYLSPQLQFLPCSSDWKFCEPFKFTALKRGQRDGTENDYGFSPDSIYNSRAGFNGESENLRALDASEATLSYMEEHKRSDSMIYNRCSEIQKDNSESFEALNILANMAIWVLDNIDMGEDPRAKASSEQWGIFHPTGVLFRQKRVIRRAKNAFKSLSGLHCDANKKVAANSELFSGSFGFIQPRKNQVPEFGVQRELDQTTIQSVRSSKRTRSQFLSFKYCDSVLQPLKKGTRR